MRRYLLSALALGLLLPGATQAACCYFSAKNADILQPAQKVFITWDPAEKVETFTVQPKFEGNALDFGMVIPTPTQPKLSEMPRDFFKHLAVYTIMRKREFAHSKLLPQLEPQDERMLFLQRAGAVPAMNGAFLLGEKAEKEVRKPAIKILEAGVVGSLGAYLVWHIGQIGQVSQDLEVPMWIVYLCVPIGSYLMCFRFLQVALAFRRTGELPSHDHAVVKGLEDETKPAAVTA